MPCAPSPPFWKILSTRTNSHGCAEGASGNSTMAPGGVRRSARWRRFVQIRVRLSFRHQPTFPRGKIHFSARNHPVARRAPHARQCVKVDGMATARVPAPGRCTRLPPPDRVTSLSRRASALAFRRTNASASSRAAVSGSASLPALDAPPPSDPRTGTTRSLFCFGLRYTSLGLAETLRRAGWRVATTVPSAARARALEAAGSPAFVWCPDEKVPRRRRRRGAAGRDARARFRRPPTEREISREHNREEPFSMDPVLADADCVAALERSSAPKRRNRVARVAEQHGRVRRPRGKIRGRNLAVCADDREDARAPGRGTIVGGVRDRFGVSCASSVWAACTVRGSFARRGGARTVQKRRRLREKNSRALLALFVARCHVRDVVAILCASMRQVDDERIFERGSGRPDVQRGGRRARAARRRARVRGGASLRCRRSKRKWSFGERKK